MDDYRKAHQDSHQPEIHVMKLDVSLLSQAHCVLVYCVWCGIPSSHAFGDRLRIVIQLCTFCDQATRVAYIKTVVATSHTQGGITTHGATLVYYVPLNSATRTSSQVLNRMCQTK